MKPLAVHVSTAALLAVGVSLMACSDSNSVSSESTLPEFSESETFPGGNLTSKRLSKQGYVVPGHGISAQEKLNFWTGFSLFRDPWVIAPSSTKDRDGLGPLFNTRSCISCHKLGGKADAFQPGQQKPSGLVIRLGGKSADHIMVDPVYGGQVQPRSIHQAINQQAVNQKEDQHSINGEAQLNVRYETIVGQYADGTEYQLYKPHYELTHLAYGDLHSDIGLSPRFAPIAYGAGLLDAIDESDLLAQEDIDDINSDGISAKYNRVPNVETEKLQLGRFGHKAKHPNLRQQVAAAFRDDIGITNTLFPEESCTQSQSACTELAKQGGYTAEEIPNKLLKLVVEFNQFLAVPPTRGLIKQTEQQGRALFYRIGCESCHTASYTTSANYPVAAMANQTIWPYTDLALHDMGKGLADGVQEYQANGSEWRTPPLWGLGWQEQWNNEPRYLHDGRAHTLEQAILWHGGEAASSKEQFIQLNQPEREALIAFLKAI